MFAPPFQRPFTPTTLSHKVFPQPQFWSIQLKRSNVPVSGQNTGACKKYVDLFYQVGMKNVNLYEAVNTTK